MPIPKQWILQRLLTPVLRPIARLLVGLLAVPLLRLVRRRVARWQEWDEELEKDVEHWFRAAMLLLFATKNMEMLIAAWVNVKFNLEFDYWYIAAGRIMLAIGVVETMPDQQLFSIIYPGPPRLTWKRELGVWGNFRTQVKPVFLGLLCQHLNRSSPVLAIMAAIFDGLVGWVCYVLAIVQYLIIGLVTSRNQALDVLSEFDRQVAMRREELLDEFYPEGKRSASSEAVPREAG
ncbi:MAG: DNA topoisomerase I [Planctomycetaceae bacterium]|nr:DNA topoisomerase I [Planctomycetaceae bacterium]